jgi:hypothetical protein
MLQHGDLVTEMGELYTGLAAGDARADDDDARHGSGA